MSALFLQLLNMSLTAGWLILAVMLIRLLFQKAPKALFCALWAVVALRLICPFSIESALSLIPAGEPIPQEILFADTPQIDSGFEAVDQAINPILSDSFAPNPGDSVNPLQVYTAIAANLWLLGMLAMLTYAAISYLRVHRQVRVNLPLEGNVRLCDTIDTPFIFGIVRPRIYLPSSLSEADRTHVIAHETAHLKRLDHWWKPLGFLLLGVYWFNPLMWVAYILLCRDIELACDERVLRDRSKEETAAYTQALLHCSTKQRFVSACPLAFGESNVKTRIRNALHYKKPAFWIVVAALVACLAVTVCFVTNPLSKPSLGTNSDLDGLSITIHDYDFEADPPTITVLWQNTGNKAVTYGNSFVLYRLEDGKLVDVDQRDDRAFHAIGYLLSPHQRLEKQYNLWDYDLSKNGVYCLESYGLLNNDLTRYQVRVSFTLENGVILDAPRRITDCTHEWLNATCTQEQLCLICQQTEGVPLGHTWSAADCHNPKTCQLCGITEGGTIPHTFVDATCTAPKTCTACGETVGKARDHEFRDITCTDGGVCSACGTKGTQTLPHSYSAATCTADSVCTVCGDLAAYAHGHSFTELTCTEDSVCVHCGVIGEEARGHFGVSMCTGTTCLTCNALISETGAHIYDFFGHCLWCDAYNEDEDDNARYWDGVRVNNSGGTYTPSQPDEPIETPTELIP